jgi:hypothetical protein
MLNYDDLIYAYQAKLGLLTVEKRNAYRLLVAKPEG